MVVYGCYGGGFRFDEGWDGWSYLVAYLPDQDPRWRYYYLAHDEMFLWNNVQVEEKNGVLSIRRKDIVLGKFDPHAMTFKNMLVNRLETEPPRMSGGALQLFP